MEEARRKLRVCLFFVVALAVIVGCIYYFGGAGGQEYMSEGTLVMAEEKEPESAYADWK